MTFKTKHPGYPTRSKEQPGLMTVNLQRRAGCSNDFMQSLTPSRECGWYLVASWKPTDDRRCPQQEEIPEMAVASYTCPFH